MENPDDENLRAWQVEDQPQLSQVRAWQERTLLQVLLNLRGWGNWKREGVSHEQDVDHYDKSAWGRWWEEKVTNFLVDFILEATFS